VGVAGQLTSSEVTDALAFYESKAGQGFTQSLIDQLRLPPGAVTEREYIMRYMTVDQVLELKEFVQKPVARKLMVDKITQRALGELCPFRSRELALETMLRLTGARKDGARRMGRAARDALAGQFGRIRNIAALPPSKRDIRLHGARDHEDPNPHAGHGITPDLSHARAQYGGGADFAK
jgi:hypothetical protein